MTYPPQPGQPPYGQPGQGQPSGGFPQQGGQYPGMQGYPQQYGQPDPSQYGQVDPNQYAQMGPGQYPQMDPSQYGQMSGWQPQEPKKSKTGLWVGLGVAVVAVAAFVVTAFVAPGFLLSDDEGDSGGTGTSAGGQGNGEDGGPGPVAQQIASALSNGDTATLQKLICANADELVHEVVGMAGSVGQVQLTGEPEVQGNQAIVRGTADSYDVTAMLQNAGSGWCWQGVEIDGDGGMGTPPPDGTGDTGDTGDTGGTGDGNGPAVGSTDPADLSPEGQEFLDKILSTLDSGDTKPLADMVCKGWEDALEDLEDKTKSSEKLRIEEFEILDFINAEGFTVTLRSDQGGLIVSAENTEGTYCVFSAVGY
jgi:hypothetical protein